MTREDLEKELRRFVSGLVDGRAGMIRKNTPLFESGLIDSIRILDLIAFIEASIGTRIPDQAIRLENFRSIEAISGAFADEAGSRKTHSNLRSA
jgi:methoxymalonate biosynthesis acyl carrier protein